MTSLRTIGIAFTIASAIAVSGGNARAGDRQPPPTPVPPPGQRMMMQDHRPYGGYCQGPRWGWYGARVPVRSKEEARRLLESFFEGQGVIIGVISPRPRHFVADILDRDNKIVDRVIIDRRSGRIRSMY